MQNWLWDELPYSRLCTGIVSPSQHHSLACRVALSGAVCWFFRIGHPVAVRTESRLSAGAHAHRSPNQKRWDKALSFLQNVLFLVWLVLMSLDAGRFHWSSVPVWLQSVRAIVLVDACLPFFLTFRENPYLSPVVRILGKKQGKGGYGTLSLRATPDVFRHPRPCGGYGPPAGSWYRVLLG